MHKGDDIFGARCFNELAGKYGILLILMNWGGGNTEEMSNLPKNKYTVIIVMAE